MDDIETVIRNVKDVDRRNHLMILWIDVKLKTTKIRYNLDCGRITSVTDIHELYTLKRKIAAFMRLSFEYKYVLIMMLEEIDSLLDTVNATVSKTNSFPIKSIKRYLNQINV